MIRVRSIALSRYASMLDLGGVSTPTVNTRIDVSKNNKVRAIAIDFDLIWKSVQVSSEGQDTVKNPSPISNPSPQEISTTTNIVPDIQKIESITQVLQLKRTLESRREPSKGDDITRIVSTTPDKSIDPSSSPSPTPSHLDIRSKYASKLRSKVDGGISALENVKYQRDEALKRGDASSHLYARNVSLSNASSSSPNQWIATNSGTGKLLNFLHHRSMILAFLPPLQLSTHQERKDIHQRMKDLCQQLPQIQVDYTISGLENEIMSSKDNSPSPKELANDIIQYFQSQVHLSPNATILVSDRDDYLRAGKESGMITCRIRLGNSPRGNVTAHYNVEDMTHVEDVINEINGISFNTVLSTGRC